MSAFLPLSILFLCLGSAMIIYLVLSDPESIKKKAEEKELLKKKNLSDKRKNMHDYIAKSAIIQNRKSRFVFTSEELELADIKLSPSQVFFYSLCFSMITATLALLLFGPGRALVGGLIVFKLSRTFVNRKLKSNRKRFQKQLEQALRVISSSLTSGQSLNGAIVNVSLDADQPMAGEMARIVNEARIGKDMIEAFYESARRMDSEDFEWFASAADLQRSTGGNLTEIIETVAETIRDRSELREKVRAYSSEGRASAYVLMGIPVALGIIFTILNPKQMAPLFNTTIGLMLLAGCGVLYVISALWMKKLINIKV